MEKKYVLVADDEIGVRAAIKESIHDSYRYAMVLEAIDGADAIKKMNLQKFELLILDLNMPRFDGRAVLRSIKTLPKDNRPKKILVISGEMVIEDRDEELSKDIDFLPKPFSHESIRNYILGIFEKKVAPPVSAASSFDVSIVNAFIEATFEVLKTMAQTPATKETLFLREANMVSGDISAILSIRSTSHCGSLAISFGTECFLGIVNRMLGESFKQINAENSDAVAELCNQIFGVAKKNINAAGNDLQPAIPSVVTGVNHTITHKTHGQCVVVKFNTDVGTFTIETVMEKI